MLALSMVVTGSAEAQLAPTTDTQVVRKLELDNAVLTLSGDRKTKSGESEESASFTRSISVADDIRSDKVKGSFEDGVLTVTLPKSEERKARAISIS